MLDTDGVAKRFKVDLARRVALDVETGGRVLLMAGHAGYGVVENNNSGIGFVVGNVYKARNAGVHKRGITYNGNRLALALFTERLVEAVKSRDRRAHADRAVHRAERSGRSDTVVPHSVAIPNFSAIRF